jgi:hypothetical protein
VLIARNHAETIDWLTSVIDARFNTVQKENDVGWGENGHVIEFSKGVPFIVELEQKWNNTFDHHLKDYIRHRNCGPMRTGYLNNLFHKVVFCLSARILTFVNRNQLLTNSKKVENILFSETNKILSIYPKLSCS